MVYQQRQNKKTLKLTGLKGVTVLNKQTANGYEVKFRAEARVGEIKLQKESFSTALEAAAQANIFYKTILGGIRNAKKAGYWNNVG